MEIKHFNNKLDWKSLVGIIIHLPDREVIATHYDEQDYSLYVGEFFQNNIGQTTKLALMDEEKALEILKILGYELELVDGFNYSQESKTKAKALIVVGFSILLRQGNNYTVDGMFPQNFLTQDELDHLLSEDIEQIELSEIR